MFADAPFLLHKNRWFAHLPQWWWYPGTNKILQQRLANWTHEPLVGSLKIKCYKIIIGPLAFNSSYVERSNHRLITYSKEISLGQYKPFGSTCFRLEPMFVSCIKQVVESAEMIQFWPQGPNLGPLVAKYCIWWQNTVLLLSGRLIIQFTSYVVWHWLGEFSEMIKYLVTLAKFRYIALWWLGAIQYFGGEGWGHNIFRAGTLWALAIQATAAPGGFFWTPLWVHC